jgi:hypothetical protein
MAKSIDDSISALETAYDKVLKQCYDALAADAPQETRDALRSAIEEFIDTPDTEE